MTTRNTRPIAKIAVLAIVGVAVLAYTISACSWFDGGPAPISDPDVESGRLVRLTHNNSTETNPVWSPRGDKIAFECLSDGRRGIWPFSGYSTPNTNRQVKNWTISTYSYPSNICVMNADGSGRIQLTDDENEDHEPAWSPDGSRLAFWSSRARNTYIQVVNADGSGQISLADGASPAWSPDGRKIAFSSGSYGSNSIYVMNADGSDARPITQDAFDADRPAWSPDGSKLAFTSYRKHGEDAQTYVVDADGSNITPISDELGYHYEPIWSPDGKRITYISHLEDSTIIHGVNPDGSERTLLYETPRSVLSLAWSPDGTHIAFVSEVRDASPFPVYDIFSMNVDSPGVDRLTCRRSRNINPTWSPDGSQLAFESDLTYPPEIYVIVAIERCQ